MGSWGQKGHVEGGGWKTRQSHICIRINWEGQLGMETDYATQGSSAGKESLKTFVKTHGGCSGRINSQPHRSVPWRDPQGPRMYTNTPTQESALAGPNLLVGSEASD